MTDAKKCKGYFNTAGTMSSYELQEDGSLIIRGVVIMAAGTWYDMHGIKCTFTPEVLQACADNWADNAVWTRHPGGTPREITEKVGSVINPSYSTADNAVIGDIYLHNQTEASRACSALVQMDPSLGGIRDVSAETQLEITPDDIVVGVSFTGLALVENGACETCRLPAYSAKEGDTMTDEEKKTEEIKEETTETKVEESAEETATQDNGDLLDVLIKIVGGMIPDAEETIKEVLGAEGEERVRALGRLEGCMSSWGLMPEFSKAIDEKMAAFEKALDEKLEGMTSQLAQFSAPTGLQGHGGAGIKETASAPKTVCTFGRGIPRY